jgi:hypothetical protein
MTFIISRVGGFPELAVTTIFLKQLLGKAIAEIRRVPCE